MQIDRYTKLEVNGKSVRVVEIPYHLLGPRIPCTDLYLNPNTTRSDLFYAAGYKVFDTALPQPWVDKYNDCMYGPYKVPAGVWCYDDGYGFLGEFVSDEEAMKRLGERILEEQKEVAA